VHAFLEIISEKTYRQQDAVQHHSMKVAYKSLEDIAKFKYVRQPMAPNSSFVLSIWDSWKKEKTTAFCAKSPHFSLPYELLSVTNMMSLHSL
jgi:hypothetical protein